MGSITTGVGLVSGIDIASLIDSLIALESSGKFRLQERIGLLKAQQTALLDINARLLAFKSTAASFRTNDIFQSLLANSSNSDVLSATARTSAEPGRFTFIVKQLVTTSQQLTRGYATAGATPLGMDSISFEFGQGRLDRDRGLEDLNGGSGVDRGRVLITDRDGNDATIDLTDVTSISEVVERINANADVSVTASVEDDHLVITDTSGGAGALTVGNGSGDTTATDLGIAGTGVGDTLTGSSIYFIGTETALGSLNDGNGVLIRNGVADLSFSARDGVTSFTVDLGRVDAPIDDDTLLADLNNGDGVRLNDDEEDPDLKIVARDGTEYEVDLTGVTTVGQLRTRVNTETDGHIELTLTDGEKLTVTDTVGGGGSLQVLGAGANGTLTAEDLGILEEDGVGADSFDGAAIPNTIVDPAVTTIQGVIDRINDADGNAGAITASLRADGLGLKITDNTVGAANLVVASTVGNPNAAADLGIETAGEASGTRIGERLLGGLGSVLASSLNGGRGLEAAASLEITDRAGMVLDLTNGLIGLETLDEIIDKINEEAVIQGVDVGAGLNGTGNGLVILDTSGASASNLIVTGDAASKLGIEADVAADSVRGTNLQLQYVSEATRLEDLNNGRGIGAGGFRITDGLGNTATVSIGGGEETLYDVIQEINSRGLAVHARINDNGDGLIIEEDAGALGGETPFVPIRVDSAGGSTASDLNILGAADGIGAAIDGSYERVVDLDLTDTLDDIAAKINDAGIPVNASVLNTGAGGTPYRLSLSSDISGRAGDLVIDAGDVDLGVTVLSRGEDAKVFFGADTPEDGFLLTSSTNTLDDVLEGVTIDLHSASDTPVTLTIERDESTIVDTVRGMVSAFNDVVSRMKQYDFYDVDTEQRGLLLGDPTLGRIRTALYRTASGSAVGVDGSYQYLSQVGVTFNGAGEMVLDESRLRAAYQGDRQGVEDLFAAYEFEAEGAEEIAEGVTIESSDLTYTSLGFGNLFDQLLDQLTNSINGVTTLAEDTYESQIGLLESRIETMDDRLATRRRQLTLEFTAMETALARLQSQSNALSSLAGNVANAQSLFG